MDELFYDVFIYGHNELEIDNLKKDCIQISKLFPDDVNDMRYVVEISADIYDQKENYIRTELKQVVFNIEKDDWSIEGHLKNLDDNFGLPSPRSIKDFFCEKKE